MYTYVQLDHSHSNPGSLEAYSKTALAGRSINRRFNSVEKERQCSDKWKVLHRVSRKLEAKIV